MRAPTRSALADRPNGIDIPRYIETKPTNVSRYRLRHARMTNSKLEAADALTGWAELSGAAAGGDLLLDRVPGDQARWSPFAGHVCSKHTERLVHRGGNAMHASEKHDLSVEVVGLDASRRTREALPRGSSTARVAVHRKQDLLAGDPARELLTAYVRDAGRAVARERLGARGADYLPPCGSRS